MSRELSATSKSGFSSVELLLAAAIFGMITVTVLGAIVYGRSSVATAGDRARAVALADEGIEALRSIRNAGFSNIVDGTYGLARNGNTWVLSGEPDVIDTYTRSITISTADTSRKNITSTVTWKNGTIGLETQVASRLTNWRSTIKTNQSWSNATIAGSANLGNKNNGRRVATQGNYAYVVMQSGSPSLYVVDISNSSTPSVVGTTNLANSPYNIAVEGNYAYVATSRNNAEMQVVDISNPASPSVVGAFNAAGNADAYGVRVHENYAYLSRLNNGGNNEIQIINITNKASPSLSGRYNLAQNLRDLCRLGNYLFIVSDADNQEVVVLDVTNPSSPSLAGNLDLPGTTNPTALRCFGSYIFIGQGSELRAVDVSNPASPLLVQTLASVDGSTINDIGADETNSLLFLATTHTSTLGRLEIVNASNPATMTSIKTVDIPGNPDSALHGVAFNPMLNIVAGTSSSNSQELILFRPN